MWFYLKKKIEPVEILLIKKKRTRGIVFLGKSSIFVRFLFKVEINKVYSRRVFIKPEVLAVSYPLIERRDSDNCSMARGERVWVKFQ